MADETPAQRGPDPTWLVVLAGVALVLAGIVALFVVQGHDAVASTAMVMGSALLFAGVVLPDLTGDFELGPSGLKGKLDRLKRTTEKAETQIEGGSNAAQPTAIDGPEAPPGLTAGLTIPEVPNVDRIISEILDETAVSPTAALIRLANALENELRALLAQTGVSGVRRMSVNKMISVGERQNVLPTEVGASMRLFWSLHNDIVHGSARPREAEMLRAVDSGVKVLRLLGSVPRARHYVLQANLPVFGNREQTETVQRWSALVLLSRQSEFEQHQHVFLTRRTDYRAGQPVGYAFDLESKLEGVFLSDGTEVETLEFIGDILADGTD